MNKSANLIMALGLCVFCAALASAQPLADANQPQDSGVQMALTHLSVTDQTLEVGWKIMNNTDHDIWICDGYIDWFMDKDNETLVLRRRYNLSDEGMRWEFPFPRFRYSRLRPGQEKAESLSHSLPVTPATLFSSSQGNAKYAKRLTVEVGFYDEDLAGLIVDIAEMAQELTCDTSLHSAASPSLDPNDEAMELSRRFFAGVFIARFYNLESFDYFRNSVASGGDEIIAPYLFQTLRGEQVLRIEVDNVSIPYKSDYPPLAQAEAPSGVTTILTKLDVNDTNLELSYKIKNNTDHNIWICDDVSVRTTLDFEVYLTEDEQSLLIRRCLNVPTDFIWSSSPTGRYVLLPSGQERTESLSLAVPVKPQREFAGRLATSDHARRLVVEIGFYNEDLPKLIRDTIELAEKLNCVPIQTTNGNEHEAAILMRYFKGVWIAGSFGGLSNFETNIYQEGNKQIKIPYTWQRFDGEQILRIEVNGVHIPYKEAEYPGSGGEEINPKGRTCFPAETPVWIDGAMVPISKVVAERAVRGSACATPEPWPYRVEAVQEHSGTFECRDIVLESGNRIGVVGPHYFMLDSGQWIAAQDLRSGQRLRTHAGTISIKSVTTRPEPYTGKVYNLKINNSEMYMVGEDAVIVRDY